MTEVVVETASGRVRGWSDRGVSSFKGIPYAAPPLGALRWKAPQNVVPWSDVREARSYGDMAIQAENVFGLPPDLLKIFPLGGKQKLSEDCLYLNVWTSGFNGKKRPVLFWCHGGAFITGSGSSPWTDGSNLCRLDDVVVVSFNPSAGRAGLSPSRGYRRCRICRGRHRGHARHRRRPAMGAGPMSRSSAAIRTTSPSSANRAAARR